MSSSGKVDMSSDAIAAYYRKLKDPRTDLPSAPSLGIPRDAQTATNVARLATKKEPVSAIPRPAKSSDAARASILANSNPRNSLSNESVSSLSSAAAAKSLYGAPAMPVSQPAATPNSAASAAATKVIGTSGEDYARKYLSHGYQWTDRRGSIDSISSVDISKVDLSKLQGAAQERAKARLASVDIVTHRQSPESDAQRQYDIKNAVSVYQLAEQRVKERLAEVEKSNADKSIWGTHEARQKAYEIASSASAARTSITAGKRNLGGGLYMNDDEIMSIARRLVEPDLETIQKLVGDRHEADRIAAEEKKAAQEAKDEAKSKARAEKEQEKQDKAAAKAKQREEAAKLKSEQDAARQVEKEKQAALKRQQKEEAHIASLSKKAEEAEAALKEIKSGLPAQGKVSTTSEGAKAKADISRGHLKNAQSELEAAKTKESEAATKKDEIITKHRALKEKYHSLKGEETTKYDGELAEWRTAARERAVTAGRKQHELEVEKLKRQHALSLAQDRIKNSEDKLWPKKVKEKNPVVVEAPEGEGEAAGEVAGEAGEAAEPAAESAAEIAEPESAVAESAEPAEPAELTLPEFDESKVKVTEKEPAFAPSAELADLKAQVKDLKSQRTAAEQAHELAVKDREIAEKKVAALNKELDNLVAAEGELRSREATNKRNAERAAEKEADARQEAVLNARLESTTLTPVEKAEAEAEYAALKKKKLDGEINDLREQHRLAKQERKENDQRLAAAGEAVTAAKAAEAEQKEAEEKLKAEEKQKVAEQELKKAEERAAGVRAEEAEKKKQAAAEEAEAKAANEKKEAKAAAAAKEKAAKEESEAPASAHKYAKVPAIVAGGAAGAAVGGVTGAALHAKDAATSTAGAVSGATPALPKLDPKDAPAPDSAPALDAKDASVPTLDPKVLDAKDSGIPKTTVDAPNASTATLPKLDPKDAPVVPEPESKDTVEPVAQPVAGAAASTATLPKLDPKDAPVVPAEEQKASSTSAEPTGVTAGVVAVDSPESAVPAVAQEAAATGERHQEYDEAAEQAAAAGERKQEYDEVAEQAAVAGERLQEYDEIAEEAAALGEKKQGYAEAAEAAAQIAIGKQPVEVTAKVAEPLGQPSAEEEARVQAKADEISKRAEAAQDKTFEGFDSTNEKPKHGIFSEKI